MTDNQFTRRDLLRMLVAAPTAGYLAACDLIGAGESDTTSFRELSCSMPQNQMHSGGPGKDGIPSLENPTLVQPAQARYLSTRDRVIGFEVDGQAYAVPHNILWHHEIANFSLGDKKLSVTLCPLTGSSLVFDRKSVDGAEFGVSGLLYRNNLIMYDRRDEESLWPQMMRKAACGSARGASLAMYPAIEIEWAGWQDLHPETKVVSGNTGHSRDYTRNPYGESYNNPDNGSLLFPMPEEIDDRRPPKERILGIPAGENAGIGFPFGELDQQNMNAVHANADGQDVVIFWDNLKQAAMAYTPVSGGDTLQFTVQNGKIVDEGTGSTWQVDGRADSGERQGEQLEPVPDAYTSFWFAWSAFQSEAKLWTAPSGASS